MINILSFVEMILTPVCQILITEDYYKFTTIK